MFHKRFADNTNQNSVATRLRCLRFQIFLEMMQGFPEPIRILDIGGTQQYWDMMISSSGLKKHIQVTLLNPKPVIASHPDFDSKIGDGRAMPQFLDRQYEIAFSNSTIEHVGDFNDQKAMAREVMRVGQKYYIQTPNRNFPIEPHFVFPFFQFFPIPIRVRLVQKFSLGWFSRIPDRSEALKEVTRIRLLKRSEIEILFPDAKIFQERLYGLTKSFVAYTPINSVVSNSDQ